MPAQLGTSAQSIRLCQAHTETQPNGLEHEAELSKLKTDQNNVQVFNANGEEMN